MCSSDLAFLVSSFDHRELALADARYRRGALFGRLSGNPMERARKLNAWSVNFDRRTVNAALVSQAHEQGFKVLVYTVNEPAEIEQMISWEVDGLFSDYPDRVLAIRDGC